MYRIHRRQLQISFVLHRTWPAARLSKPSQACVAVQVLACGRMCVCVCVCHAQAPTDHGEAGPSKRQRVSPQHHTDVLGPRTPAHNLGTRQETEAEQVSFYARQCIVLGTARPWLQAVSAVTAVLCCIRLLSSCCCQSAGITAAVCPSLCRLSVCSSRPGTRPPRTHQPSKAAHPPPPSRWG